MIVEKASRQFFLYLSKNKLLNNSAKKWGLKFGASNVVAGETISSVIEVVKKLNREGLICTVDHLGEFVLNKDEAIESTEYCIKTLEAIDQAGVNCNLSLKLTQLGLDIDRELCLNNIRRIVQMAKIYNNFVRIDMEDHAHCQDTLDIFNDLRQDYDNVGTAIQAYLHRAEEDLKDLEGTSVRLIKGAYKESPEVCYQDQKTIDENYLHLIKQHLLNGSYTAIATHDHQIINNLKAFTEESNIPKEQFEFQMLYGFRTELQQEIAKEGYTMRIYVPYGNDWYGYFMRRLAERPQNVSFALRGMLKK